MGKFVDLLPYLVVEHGRCEHLVQLVDQFPRQRREIVDEIERVLDFVRDAGGELAERGKLFGLHQAILRGAQFVERCGELFRARLYLIEQPHVFNSDNGLVGEGLNQFDLLLREWPYPVARKDENTHRHTLSKERDAKDRAVPSELLVFARAVFGVGEHIDNMDGLALQRHARCHGVASSLEGMRFCELFKFGWVSEVRRPAIEIAVALEDGRLVGLAEAGSRLDERIEHRLQVERRAADDFQHIGSRRLLLQRIAQLCGALFNLVLQIRIGFLQPRAHLVELVGEAFQLIAGPNRDALGEIAAADPFGTCAQGLDRHDHAACQKYPGQHREDRCRRQHDGQALQRRVEGGVGLLHRQFDKHGPAQRRDRRRRRQHLLALDIFGALQRLQTNARVPRLRRLHLNQLRHIGVAQHQADVGMRDQASSRAHHVGVAVLADLDLRHHVPDQFQVDLGNADAGVLAGTGQRQRHIGLGLPAEIDRPIIDLVGDGFGELCILGKIEAGVHDVHGKA